MGYVESNLFGVHARIFRISFSGELAYEVNVESDNGNFMWEKIIEVGKGFCNSTLRNRSFIYIKNRNGTRSRIRIRWKNNSL